ncbi:MAG TPA: branched-chain amino acid ABC transporter permease [Rhodoblastus sp.]|nr:branched-chain amino acid ABC transporter permease [Rhodoblastus sp.]
MKAARSENLQMAWSPASGRPVAALSALAVALCVGIGLWGGESLLVRSVEILIFALFAQSLNLIVGQTGMVSMCHAAFYATAGYVFGVLQTKYGWHGASGAIGAAAAAIGASLLLAIGIGLLISRVSHAYFIMLTLALGQLVYVIIWKWHAMTGGDDGLIGIVPPPGLQQTRDLFLVFLPFVLGSLGILFCISRSAFGLTLTAIRDNPTRAAFIGIPVRQSRLAAFVIAAGFAGLAGVGEAIFHRGMFPNDASFLTSADALVVVVLGGTRWFLGPIVGAVLFKALTFGLPALTDYWLSCLGLIIIAVALAMPGGVLSVLSSVSTRSRGV